MSDWQVLGDYAFAAKSAVAGVVASVACGLGVFPLFFRGLDVRDKIGMGYAFAGGLMISASVYNLLLPAFTLGTENSTRLWPVLQTLGGLVLGCAFIHFVERLLTPERLKSRFARLMGGRVALLVFVAMSLHSIPEGVAVGVGFATETHLENAEGLGMYIAVAISIHNMPEGLAVALPLRAEGASVTKCFIAAFLTSLPQPIAAVPASLLVWLFEPLMLPFLGFAAGAMMYLVIAELIPDALETRGRNAVAWAFMTGFAVMALVQVAL